MNLIYDNLFGLGVHAVKLNLHFVQWRHD